MIRIGQASSSETYSKFGTPPNQRRTGVTPAKPGGNMDGELNIEPFHSGFTAVFRCVDTKIADKMATFVERAIANGSHIGYGQNWIDTQYPMCGLYDALNESGETDPGKVTKLVNCTCATLIGDAAYFSGIYDPRFRLLNTGEQEAILMQTGKFIKLTDKDLLTVGRGCRRGDILHRIGHTAMILDTDLTEATEPRRIGNGAYRVNLRTGPGTENKIITEINENQIVELISTSSNGWGQVIYGGKIGFVSGKYLTHLDTAKASGDVWMRSEAGKSFDKIIVIPKGASVWISGDIKKVGLTPWYRVWFAGKTGWASGKYIKR